MPSILFVLTSAEKTLTGTPTVGFFAPYIGPLKLNCYLPRISLGMVYLSSLDRGLHLTRCAMRYLPEAAHPYYILAPHATIDFASPAGANPPIEPTSITLFASDAECTKFLADEEVQRKLASAKKLSEVSSKDYDAIFYVGGHGPPIDLAVDPINIKLASEACVLCVEPGNSFLTANQFFQAGKITSAVCHGSAALVGATDAEGKSIFAGRRATGFTNAEEIQIDKVKDVPFLLEDKLKSLGAKFEKADELWGSKSTNKLMHVAD
ncbi:Glutathione-independent glyoxalase HSP31 [Mycena venus]|uniref:D-lactate dehydratase n=1 Tax=Mycena venus TaxID=2733690 RepID=A0A8H7D157_9AGAR|nr:Glutathione-independent glyoxalase HSP31 [Mycena venus]